MSEEMKIPLDTETLGFPIHTVIAPSAFDDQIGKEVPITDRYDPSRPKQIGVGTCFKEENGVGISIQLFHSSHTLECRGELSTNNYDVHCLKCACCSCHQPNYLLKECKR